MESYLTRNAPYSTRPHLRYSTGRVTIPKRITIARESNVSFVHDSFVPLNTFTKTQDAPGRGGSALRSNCSQRGQGNTLAWLWQRGKQRSLSHESSVPKIEQNAKSNDSRNMDFEGTGSSRWLDFMEKIPRRKNSKISWSFTYATRKIDWVRSRRPNRRIQDCRFRAKFSLIQWFSKQQILKQLVLRDGLVWKKIFRDIKTLKFHKVSRMLLEKSIGWGCATEIWNLASPDFAKNSCTKISKSRFRDFELVSGLGAVFPLSKITFLM